MEIPGGSFISCDSFHFPSLLLLLLLLLLLFLLLLLIRL